MRSTALPFVLACLVAAPAAADVTVTATTTGKAPIVGDLTARQTTRIKGNKMRIDSVQGDKETAIILDIDGQRMITLDAKKQRSDGHAGGQAAGDAEQDVDRRDQGHR